MIGSTKNKTKASISFAKEKMKSTEELDIGMIRNGIEKKEFENQREESLDEIEEKDEGEKIADNMDIMSMSLVQYKTIQGKSVSLEYRLYLAIENIIEKASGPDKNVNKKFINFSQFNIKEYEKENPAMAKAETEKIDRMATFLRDYMHGIEDLKMRLEELFLTTNTKMLFFKLIQDAKPDDPVEFLKGLTIPDLERGISGVIRLFYSPDEINALRDENVIRAYIAMDNDEHLQDYRSFEIFKEFKNIKNYYLKHLVFPFENMHKTKDSYFANIKNIHNSVLAYLKKTFAKCCVYTEKKESCFCYNCKLILCSECKESHNSRHKFSEALKDFEEDDQISRIYKQIILDPMDDLLKINNKINYSRFAKDNFELNNTSSRFTSILDYFPIFFIENLSYKINHITFTKNNMEAYIDKLVNDRHFLDAVDSIETFESIRKDSSPEINVLLDLVRVYKRNKAADYSDSNKKSDEKIAKDIYYQRLVKEYNLNTVETSGNYLKMDVISEKVDIINRDCNSPRSSYRDVLYNKDTKHESRMKTKYFDIKEEKDSERNYLLEMSTISPSKKIRKRNKGSTMDTGKTKLNFAEFVDNYCSISKAERMLSFGSRPKMKMYKLVIEDIFKKMTRFGNIVYK